MEAREIADDHGNHFQIMEWQGEFLPSFCTKETIESVQTMPFRPDDIIICVYPKSGTHWVQEMVRMLLAQTAEPCERERMHMLEFPFTSREDYDKMPSPRVMTSHFRFHNLPKGILEAQCRLVVVERNIKDAAVSMFNHVSKLKRNLYTGDWPGFAQMYLQGNCLYNSYFDHVKGYRQAAKDHPELDMLFLRYEQIKKDHVGELGRLSRFLGLDTPPELLEDIARVTDFQSMQKYKNDLHSQEKEVFITGKNEMFRKGEVGDWKNWFTVAQSEMFDAEYLKQMGEPFQEM